MLGEAVKAYIVSINKGELTENDIKSFLKGKLQNTGNLMQETNLKLKDIIADNDKLTFLVGAGCSVDPPSCLPAGRAMMEYIIRFTCPQSEIPKLLSLDQLRFEQYAS